MKTAFVSSPLFLNIDIPRVVRNILRGKEGEAPMFSPPRVGQIQSILSLRADAAKAVMAAIGIGLGVNLIATGLALQSKWSGAEIGAAGGILILFVGGLFAISILPRFRKDWHFEGLLLVKSLDQAVIEIPGYSFGHDMRQNIRALSLENKALGKAWSDSALSGIDIAPTEDSRKVEEADKAKMPMFSVVRLDNIEHKETASIRLVREASEYFVLRQLSFHLDEYFGSSEDPRVVVKRRRDIPNVLLDNHFLELFSRPIEEREAFSDHKEGVGPGETYAIFTREGAVYDLFELVLPRGTNITRPQHNAIRISTTRFSLTLHFDFDGYAEVPPTDFVEMYVGIPYDKYSAFKVPIHVDFQFKAWAFFSRAGWEYFQWIDSFVERLEENFSFDYFIKRIGWESAHTAAILDRNLSVAQHRTKDDAIATDPREKVT